MIERGTSLSADFCYSGPRRAQRTNTISYISTIKFRIMVHGGIVYGIFDEITRPPKKHVRRFRSDEQDALTFSAVCNRPELKNKTIINGKSPSQCQLTRGSFDATPRAHYSSLMQSKMSCGKHLNLREIADSAQLFSWWRQTNSYGRTFAGPAMGIGSSPSCRIASSDNAFINKNMHARKYHV